VSLSEEVLIRQWAIASVRILDLSQETGSYQKVTKSHTSCSTTIDIVYPIFEPLILRAAAVQIKTGN
jgi:hypothetical protein